jgi:hypothetical protein
MRKFIILLLAFAATLAVQAGQVYDRSKVTTAVATGIGVITPSADYAGIELKKVWVEGAAESNVVATVYRVVDSGAYTQSVATATVAANLYRGSGVPSQYAAIKSGEYFYITTLISSAGTNAVVILDYEVQTHD